MDFDNDEWGKYEAKDFVEQACLVALARIRYVEKRITALHLAIGNGDRNSYTDNRVDAPALKTHLYQELNQAYSELFMFGLLTKNKDLEKKALEMASERYLREGMHIMSYLDIYNRGGSYSVLEDVEFRADIAAALIEKGLDPTSQLVDCPKCHAHKGQSCRDEKMKKIPAHDARGVAAINYAVNQKGR